MFCSSRRCRSSTPAAKARQWAMSGKARQTAERRTRAPSAAGNRRPRGPACVPISCAACWRAPYRELATAGREGQLVCRGNRRPGRPACVPISCTACWQAGSDQPSHPVEPTESLSAGVRPEPRQQSCMGRGPPAQAGRGPPAELERGPPP